MSLSESPLILKEQRCSYETLSDLLRRWNFASSPTVLGPSQEPSASTYYLSPELVHHCISFLSILPVDSTQVTAVGCSSTDAQHDLSECLTERTGTWWISASHSMPRGTGREWVELQLGETARRMTAVCLHIPPLPVGPLSVREFTLQVLASSGSLEWKELAQDTFVVANRTGMQRFLLEEPVDAYRVRIVCLSNQMSEFIPVLAPRMEYARYECVGFYTVRLE